MSTKKKLLEAAAGAAGGGVTYVDDVFSTYLYEGIYSNRDIVNGIDLAGEGGLVWTKRRNAARSHDLSDTERGVTKSLSTNSADAEGTDSQGLLAFNSNGYRIGGSTSYNNTNDDYVSWTFRKQPGFFDVVTYTGNSQSVSGVNQTISHNLGTEPGMIIVKRTDGSRDWMVYHRSLGATKYLKLNSYDLEATSNHVWVQTPTSTEFYVGQDYGVNGTNHEYVAYLFAHDAQDFGEDSDEAVIKCGSYTGNGSSAGPVIDLGFEPQWLLIKCSSHDGQYWMLFDSMRGIVTNGTDTYLLANDFSVENAYQFVNLTSTGFQPNTHGSYVNANGYTYTYMAIRRPNKPASEFAATDLFSVDQQNGDSSVPTFVSGFPVDMMLRNDVSAVGDTGIAARLTGNVEIKTNATTAEAAQTYQHWDYMDGHYSWATTYTGFYSWMWRRAPSFFDVVTYKGNNSNPRTLNHNLGVEPEMMWIKLREAVQDWDVYVKVGGTEYGYYGVNAGHSGLLASMGAWNNTSPTATQFTVSSANNNGSYNYVCYLWASVPGISKFGTYSGTGSELTVDCGFSSGARFVLLKRIDAAMGSSGQGWFVFDTVRGITSSSSPYIALSDTDAQVSGSFVKPDSSGFKVTTQSVVNTNGGTYMFYAIA